MAKLMKLEVRVNKYNKGEIFRQDEADGLTTLLSMSWGFARVQGDVEFSTLMKHLVEHEPEDVPEALFLHNVRNNFTTIQVDRAVKLLAQDNVLSISQFVEYLIKANR